MIVIGGGVPRNTIQSSALASKKGLDYAVVITMDRPETGGLSGSTLEETVSWGKMKGEADNVMVIGDALMVFPIHCCFSNGAVRRRFQTYSFSEIR